MGFNFILLLIFPKHHVVLIIMYCTLALFSTLKLTEIYLVSKRSKKIKNKINELHFQKK